MAIQESVELDTINKVETALNKMPKPTSLNEQMSNFVSELQLAESLVTSITDKLNNLTRQIDLLKRSIG